MSDLENEEEKQGAKKEPWKPRAVSKAEKLAARSADKYAQYEKRLDKKVSAGPLPAEVFKKETAEPMYSKLDRKLEHKESDSKIANEPAHKAQESKAKPDSKLGYLKYPASKAEPDTKAKSEKIAKKVIVADRKKNCSAPADSDTLAALAEKMFEKLSVEAELERDVTGAD